MFCKSVRLVCNEILCISSLKMSAFTLVKFTHWWVLISVHEHVILTELICHLEGVSRILLDYFLYICLFSMSLHFRFITVNWRLGGSSKLAVKIQMLLYGQMWDTKCCLLHSFDQYLLCACHMLGSRIGYGDAVQW